YLMGGHVIETETIDATNMDACKVTKEMALAEMTPITTRYGANVVIAAECKELSASAQANIRKPAL
ncbi:MAG: hypothetical protein AB7P48_09350, partial [Methylocystis sp.]